MSDKPLNKFDQSEKQCLLLQEQSKAKCKAALTAHGGPHQPLFTKLPPLPNSASK